MYTIDPNAFPNDESTMSIANADNNADDVGVGKSNWFSTSNITESVRQVYDNIKNAAQAALLSERANIELQNNLRKQNEEILAELQKNQITWVEIHGEDSLQIGDILFAMPRELTPPMAIQIKREMTVLKWQALRSNAAEKIPTGQTQATISLTLMFVGEQAIDRGLGRLLATFEAMPFIYIENKFIRHTFMPNTMQNMAVTPLAISIRTIPEMPNVLAADLELAWFNYFPFANDFLFRKQWNPRFAEPGPTARSIAMIGANQEDVRAGKILLDSQLSPVTKLDPKTAFSSLTSWPDESGPYKLALSYHDTHRIAGLTNSINFKYRDIMVLPVDNPVPVVKSKLTIDEFIKTTGTGVITSPWSDSRTLKVKNPKYDPKTVKDTKEPEFISQTGPHHGIDVGGKIGDPLRSLISGTVLFSSKRKLVGQTVNTIKGVVETKTASSSGGNSITIRSANTRIAVTYCHCTDIFKDEGDIVSAGDVIATIGNTGRTSGPHLHFSTTFDGQNIDPYKWETVVEFQESKNKPKTLSPEQIATQQTVKEKIAAYEQEGWKVDHPNTNTARVVMYRELELEIKERDTKLIPVQIMFSKHNIIAPIPIVGHEYPTYQYLGAGDAEAVIVFLADGIDGVRQLQYMISTVQRNARIARTMRNSAYIGITNSILNFGGINSILIENIDVKSMEGMPDVYQVVLRVTQVKERYEQVFKQEYTKQNATEAIKDYTIKHLIDLTNPSIIQALRYLAHRATFQEVNVVAGHHNNDRLAQTYDKVVNGYRSDFASTIGIDTSSQGISSFLANLPSYSAPTTLSSFMSNMLQNINQHQQAKQIFQASLLNTVDKDQVFLRDHPAYTYRTKTTFNDKRGTIYQTVSEEELAKANINIEDLRKSPVTIRRLGKRDEDTRWMSESERAKTPFFVSETISLEGQEAVYQDIWKDTPASKYLQVFTNLLAEFIITMPDQDIWKRVGLGALYSIVSKHEPDYNFAYQYADPDAGYLIEREIFNNKFNEYQKELVRRAATSLAVATAEFQDNDGMSDPLYYNLLVEYPGIFSEFNRDPCYPDLHLPPHPATNQIVDTRPDFWFYNNSIDGNFLLSSNMPNIRDQAKEIARNTYNSIKQFSDPLEEKGHPNGYQQYKSPNKKELNTKTQLGVAKQLDEKSSQDDKNINSDAKGRVASYHYEEGGLPQPYKTTLKFEANNAGDTDTFDQVLRPGGSKQKFNQLNLKNIAVVDKEKDSLIEFGNKIINANRDLQGKSLDDLAMETQNLVATNGYKRQENMVDAACDQFTNEGFDLIKAFPTFKIYFIEEDIDESGRQNIVNFNDLFSYSAIKDIRIVRDRKVAADLCVISILNVTGSVEMLAFKYGEATKPIEIFNPLTVDTKKENPFAHLLLVEGNNIQVRLGYSNDPSDLETLFNGRVVEIGYSPNSPDIIQLVCQSYAAELVAEEKYSGIYTTTQALLSSLICSPECLHFGRYSQFHVPDVGEARSTRTGGLSSPGIAGWNYFQSRIENDISNAWRFLNKPQDDNVYAPNVNQYKDSWGNAWKQVLDVLAVGKILEWLGIWDVDSRYQVWGTTIWDVFQEMTLRHPGYIATALPYNDRYTMFFGTPENHYWSRDMTQLEKTNTISYLKARNTLTELLNGDSFDRYAQVMADISLDKNTYLKRTEANLPAYAQARGYGTLGTDYKEQIWPTMRGIAMRELDIFNAFEDYSQLLEYQQIQRNQRFRPFRNYHMIASDINLVANNLYASAHGVGNAINLIFMEDTYDKSAIIQDNTQKNRAISDAVQQEGDILNFKIDDNIPDHAINTISALYTTCNGSYFARRYAIALLMQSMRDVYKGDITILGNAKIKPYDICVLFDKYRDIFGPVEVGRVTHIFSHETGFITQIKPDMIVTHDSYCTQSTMDAMVNFITNQYGVNATMATAGVAAGMTSAALGGVTAGVMAGKGFLTGGVLGAVAEGSGVMSTLSAAGSGALGGLLGVSTLGLVGLTILGMGGYKIAEWSQTRQPLFFTPLIHHGKPLIAGLDGYKRDSLIDNISGKWTKFKRDVKAGFGDWYENSPITSWLKENASDWTQ